MSAHCAASRQRLKPHRLISTSRSAVSVTVADNTPGSAHDTVSSERRCSPTCSARRHTIPDPPTSRSVPAGTPGRVAQSRARTAE